MPAILRLLVLIAGLLLGCVDAFAQAGRLLPVDDWAYRYIQRLQRRGHLLALHPTALPYTAGDVAAALARLDRDALTPTEQRWAALLDAALRPTADPAAPPAFVFGARAAAGLRAANTDRLDVLRPTDRGRPTLEAGGLRLFPEAAVHAFLARGPAIAHAGLQFDLYYRDDPDALDAANRLISRSTPTYVGYHGRLASAYLGRFRNQWGLPDKPALLVSDNPAAYDQITFRLGTDRLALRSLLGELDSITADGRFTGWAGADSVAASERRFVAAHRFDWRPSRHVAVSVMESALYSGPNTGLSLKYLNPLHLYAVEIDSPPKNDENNGLLAGILWLYLHRVTLHGQLLLDDFDFLGHGNELPSMALTGSLLYAGAVPTVDVGLDLTLVSARAYNTHQPEGRYLFLLRGLATQFNDYVHSSLYADLYLDGLLPGLVVTPRLDLLWQGEHDLRRPYPAEETPFILTGTAERTARLGVQLYYQPGPHWWLRFDYGANLVGNAGFVPDARATRLTGLLEVGARLSLTNPLGDL